MAGEHKQYNLPELPPQSATNIIYTGDASVVKDGSLKSPNYAKGEVGWSINSDGSAEFNGEVTIEGVIVESKGTFGGDGSDGALDVTSGTTTINAASAKIVKKNYTTGNIAAGTVLTISNPHANGTILWLKFTGDVTINGTINMASMGANGGAGDTNVNGSGAAGLASNYVWVTANHGGRGGTSTAGGNSGAGGGGGGNYTVGTVGGDGTGGTAGGAAGLAVINFDAFIDPNVFGFFRALSGAGGGGGGYASSNGGDGGKGGGCIIIECIGNLTFGSASVLTVAGGAGSNGTDHTSNPGGGGGGGGGGTILVLYNGTLVDSGVTKTVSGGAGGAGGVDTTDGSDNGGAGGAGGSGFSLLEANTQFS